MNSLTGHSPTVMGKLKKQPDNFETANNNDFINRNTNLKLNYYERT